MSTARLDDLSMWSATPVTAGCAAAATIGRIPPDRPIRLVKIDVEGGELQVLRGGVATLTRCRPFVIFEHGKGGADYYGTTTAAVHDLLVAQCGLRISLMERWLAGGRPFTRAEFIEHFDRGRDFYFLAHP